MTSPPDDTTTDLHAVNAALRAERDAALAREAALAEALATRNSEYGERIAHQAATIDVLKAMSASPGDPQPVFDLIVTRARDLCDGYGATVFEFDGTLIHWRAATGFSDDPTVRGAAQAMFPMAPTREWGVGRAILERRVIRIDDLETEPGLSPALRAGTAKSTVTIPLMRGDVIIGALSLSSRERGGFSDTQIDLLKTFAEQAVIAITSAETYRALQTRTSDLQESLEYQTATSDVLKVISRSAFDLEPVLSLVAETSARLCLADQAAIFRLNGDLFNLAANFGFSPEYEAMFIERGPFAPDPASPTVVNRAAIEGRAVHIHDVGAVPGDPDGAIRLGRQRTSLGVPLLREGEPVGVILLARQQVDPFTERQIELVSTFADQAVIAMENARLLTEQREALEQQTATAEVLQVINASPGNLAPVFEAMLDKAIRLCEAAHGHLLTYDGECFHLAAASREHYAEWARQVGAVRPGPSAPLGRISRGERIVHIADLREEEVYRTSPAFREQADIRGARSQITVGLFKDNTLLGAMIVYRQEVRPFSDKQIALLENFAAQAVIAIENTRLLTEQQEALERQTATAEVLQVINASPGNLTPVFDAMLERATRLCEATFGELWEGLSARPVALFGVPTAYAEFRSRDQVHGQGTFGALLREGHRVIHFEDLIETEAYANGDPGRRAMVDLGGARSAVAVPLLKDQALRGAIVIYRHEVRPFTEKQIALLQNFAAQAVIAMENARLITEQREALEQQTATAEVLQVINASPGNLTPVFDAILEKAMRLCAVTFGSLYTYDGLNFHSEAQRGVPEAYAAFREKNPPKPEPGSPIARVIKSRRPLHILDVMADEAYAAGQINTRAQVELGGTRTVLIVPLLKDETFHGHISLYRQEVCAFSGKQIALLENFAAQAVIAMENARLLTETREALEQQTATAEVLRVINESPGNLTPVFKSILEKAHTLCGASIGSLFTYDGEFVRAVATLGQPEDYVALLSQPHRPQSVARRLVGGERFAHVLDFKALQFASAENIVNVARRTAMRTLLQVPLRKEGTLVGYISAARPEVRPFSAKEIALLENFAAQAVIAMENARLLDELRQRTGDLQETLEYQTATSDVLKVISGSGFALEPVFQAVVTTAARLCLADQATIYRYEDGEYGWAAGTPMPADYERIERSFRTGPGRGSLVGRVALEKGTVQILDAWNDSLYTLTDDARVGGVRTMLGVPLMRDGVPIGVIAVARYRVEPFTDRQIDLVSTFAAQAVIAIENTRLITEQREALEQQTATAEVLQVLNTSPGNLAPVFDVMLQKALSLCGAAFGQLVTYDGTAFRAAAWRGYEPGPNATAPLPGMALYQLAHGEQIVHIPDITADDVYRSGNPVRRRLADEYGGRTAIWVALRKDEELLGAFVIYRTEVRSFSNKHIALLQNFAAQAVIAIENARLLNELRQRQEELRITFENMGDGVAMFDETLRLVAWNRKFQEILDVTNEVITSRLTYADYIRYLSERGEYGPGTDPEAQLRLFQGRAREHYMFERIRPDGRVIEVRHNPVPGGGFVLIYADITERKRSEEEIRAARDAAEEASRTIEAAYRDLKAAQANLIQAEKMASLGQLTAGIAHEIKNPLNFVNNFAALSVDLLDELKEAAAPGFAALTEKQRVEIDEVSAMLTGNLEKITEHGRRADSIVKAMLEHSRGSSGELRMVDLNSLIDEALNLAYHGARAQDQSFNITLERDFGEGIAPIEVNPQDMTRVFLNLFANGFYAVTRRARDGGDAGFKPALRVTTRDADEAVEIRVRDNGIGIPADIKDRLFQPFFTTKPTGEGTGLGLSITYDIVTQQHGGSIAVESEVGDYSEFTIWLPRSILASEGGRA